MILVKFCQFCFLDYKNIQIGTDNVNKRFNFVPYWVYIDDLYDRKLVFISRLLRPINTITRGRIASRSNWMLEKFQKLHHIILKGKGFWIRYCEEHQNFWIWLRKFRPSLPFTFVFKCKPLLTRCLEIVEMFVKFWYL